MPNADAPTDEPMRADALVMFGLTGDLGDKKLLPALGEMAVGGSLDLPVIAVSRSGIAVEELRDRIAAGLDDHECDDEAVEAAVAGLDLRSVDGSVDDEGTWDEITAQLEGRSCPVVYAALPPALFATTARRMAASSLPGSSRLVVEKPFGDDLASARALWADITAQIDPDRLYVVDHFLAKTAVENLATVRTCNPVIANNLRPGLVESVDVVLHESAGVDGRGSFYESVGAIRDVVQNHMLQTLALATMRLPAGTGAADAGVRARQELLDAVRPADPARVTLGQYEGYCDLDDVEDDSVVETYAALELEIDVDPWRGVPIRLETGKALHEQRTAVVFTVRSDEAPGRDRIVFDISPTPCISVELDALRGDDHEVEPVLLTGRPDDDHDGFGDYATMLRSALSGDRRHFATIDGILAAWRIVDPVNARRPAPLPYEPGTTGPYRRI